MTLITDEVLQRHYKAARAAGADPAIVDDPDYRNTLETVLRERIGVARRINKPAAKAAFNRGATIAVSDRGHEQSFNVYPTTTVHTRTSTTWESLDEQVREWSNRYSNQRYYIISYTDNQEV
jgi:hypothetical protein